jgi:hypothetical protein
MPRRRLLIVIGFAITVVSTVVSSVLIVRSERDQREQQQQISQLREARAQARSLITESSAKADSASVLFALGQSPGMEAGAKSHYLSFSGRAIEQAFGYKCQALQALRKFTTEDSPNRPEAEVEICAGVDAAAGAPAPTGSPAPARDSKLARLIDEFLSPPKGEPTRYAELLERDEALLAAWLEADRKARAALRGKEQELATRKSEVSTLRSLGAALAILGLMIVLARDLST